MKEFDERLEKRNSIVYLAIIISFFLLNIFNTYFVTTTTLNKHVVSFGRTISGEINSFIGNFLVVFLIYIIISSLTKNIKKQILSLTIATFLLNLGVYLLYIFTKYYSVVFSVHDLSLFNNPSTTLVGSIFIESLIDLVLYYRFIIFVPTAVMISLYRAYHKDGVIIKCFFPRTIRQSFIAILLVIPLSVLNLGVYSKISADWTTNVARNTHTAQNIGLYSFYLYEFTGGNFKIKYNIEDEHKTIDELISDYEIYNKNKNYYKNLINEETYSQTLTFVKAPTLEASNEIILSNNVNKIFKDKNVVLVHLESYTYLLQELGYLNKFTPFINALLKESYVMHNFYAPVGLGTSADAELSVLTGVFPTGDTTLYWDYKDRPFELKNIPSYFKEINYHTEAIHADTPVFYNRGQIYEKLYNFDKYFNLNDFENPAELNDFYNHQSPWVSDYVLIDEMMNQYNNAKSNSNNVFMFPMTMMPHIPFDYIPSEFEDNTAILNELPNNLKPSTEKYLSFLPYYDDYMKHFFYDKKSGNSRYLDDTVYIFYGDHGVKLEKDDLSLLMGRELTELEARQINSKTIAFVYYPNQDGIEVIHDGVSVREGLFKGDQYLVRSQVDLYRTMIELFDLPNGKMPYFGVNVLSEEPSFTIDNRTYDIYYDQYDSNSSSYVTQGISLMDSKVLLPNTELNQELINKIKTLKHLNDLFVINNLYSEWYRRLA